jgi:hypothetical protein
MVLGFGFILHERPYFANKVVARRLIREVEAAGMEEYKKRTARPTRAVLGF